MKSSKRSDSPVPYKGWPTGAVRPRKMGVAYVDMHTQTL